MCELCPLTDRASCASEEKNHTILPSVHPHPSTMISGLDSQLHPSIHPQIEGQAQKGNPRGHRLLPTPRLGRQVGFTVLGMFFPEAQRHSSLTLEARDANSWQIERDGGQEHALECFHHHWPQLLGRSYQTQDHRQQDHEDP